MKNKKHIKKILLYIFLIGVSIMFFFPFYFLIVSATNTSVDVAAGRLLPGRNLIKNLQTMLATTDLLNAMKNSLVVATVQTIVSIFLSSMAGYGFEIHPTKGKERVYIIILLSMMIPFAAMMIPLFQMFGLISNYFPAIGLDTLTGIMLPYFSTAFLIFFFRQNTKMFPKALLEAGRIDGLSEIGLFIRIYMPTMKSTYTAAAIVTFMNSWNNYMWPLVAVQSNKNRTVPLILSALGSSYSPDYGAIMVAILISTLPVAILFFALQKHFVAGMLGSVK